MTAYLFEPSAHSAVRNAHQARIDGDQHHPFVDSDTGNAVEDCDKTIPPGTQVVVRPRFPRVSTTRQNWWSFSGQAAISTQVALVTLCNTCTPAEV